MTNNTIKVTVDTTDAVAAVNELTAAIERAMAALQRFSVAVVQEAPANPNVIRNQITAQQMVDQVRSDLHVNTGHISASRIWANRPRDN